MSGDDRIDCEMHAAKRTDAEIRQRILDERAAKLARKPSRAEGVTGALTEVVFFRRCSVRYGAELLLLRDIQETPGVTHVPSTTPWCLGVINLRGEIVPVLDLARLFGSAADDDGRAERVLVVEHEGRRLGLAADHVDDSVALRPDEVHEPLSSFHGVRARLIQGIADHDVLIVDCRRLVADDHLFT